MFFGSFIFDVFKEVAKLTGLMQEKPMLVSNSKKSKNYSIILLVLK